LVILLVNLVFEGLQAAPALQLEGGTEAASEDQVLPISLYMQIIAEWGGGLDEIRAG
jgi:hypothetical protein